MIINNLILSDASGAAQFSRKKKKNEKAEKRVVLCMLEEC